MAVYRELEPVPDALESAYRERRKPAGPAPEANGAVPSDQKVTAGWARPGRKRREIAARAVSSAPCRSGSER